MDQKAVIEQIDAVLERWERARSQSNSDDLENLGAALTSEILMQMQATVLRVSPPGSPYRKRVEPVPVGYANLFIPDMLGVLRALRGDCAVGYIATVHELINAELFADFLEMAEHLLDEGYKDPAAVLGGSVPEEHLRKLCAKNEIAVEKDDGRPKKADALNAELAGRDVYTKLDQKSVTAWLDLRNKAAHGHYTEYTKEQVALMVQAVRDFITRHPA